MPGSVLYYGGLLLGKEQHYLLTTSVDLDIAGNLAVNTI